MAPLDRRRLTAAPYLLIIFFLFSFTASVASAVLGIDLGTEYIKAVLVKPGIPLEIVLTKDSKRKEVSAVAFNPLKGAQLDFFPERVYGSDAIALAARIPGDVYPNLKPLLGLHANRSSFVDTYKERHPALKLLSHADRDTVAFRSQAFGKSEEVFGVEELLAMELKNIRSNAESLAGKRGSIKDVVLTVPAFYTAEELRAVELAAELADLNILSLVSDGLAVGINYATSRTFPSINEGARAEHHLIFDMGAGSTSATILQFQGRTVKDVGKLNKTIQEVNVLGTGWDRTLGGDSLNAMIVDRMVKDFTKTPAAQKHGFTLDTVKAHGRTAAKLWKEAERLRQVLSANSETMASFEGLYEEVDFRFKLSRAGFEEMASPLSERLVGPVKRALDAAKLAIDDLDSIILHGGATRTPFVQARLEQLVGDPTKIRSNVNADEAAVFGAAFRGAGLSPSFRVKDIKSRDGVPYSVGVQWSHDGKERRQKVFLPTSQRGLEKYVPFKKSDDFSFVVYQQVPTDEAVLQYIDTPVLKIETQNLTISVAHLIEKVGCAKGNITTGFAFRLNIITGLPEVVYGTVRCESDSTEKKSGVVDDVKGFFGFGSKSDEQKPFEEEVDDKESSTSVDEANEASTSSQRPTSSLEASADVTKHAGPKKRTETVYIKFSSTTEGTLISSTAELKRSKDRLSAFDASDRSRRLREESLNTLEAFVYRARDLLTDESFIAASSAAERSKLQIKLHEASEWLSDDGADAGRKDLDARLKELRDIVSPVELRKEEAIKRPQEIKLLREAINQTRSLVNVVAEQVKRSDEAALSVSASVDEESIAATSTTDEFADLEDSTSTISTAVTPSPSVETELPAYTSEDVSSLTAVCQSVEDWLAKKIDEQAKLSAHEDPVILSEDIAVKAKELNKAVMDMLQKSIRVPPKPKPSGRARTKSSRGKDRTKKSTSSTPAAREGATKSAEDKSNSGEGEVGDESPEQSGSRATGKNGEDRKNIHDEL